MENGTDVLGDTEDRGLRTFVECYSAVGLEILDLVNVLKQSIQAKALRGEVYPELMERLTELDSMAELVHRETLMRAAYEQEMDQREGAEFMGRLKADCPTCGKETSVHIIGDAVHHEAKTTNDLVRCTVCSTEFVNPIPNSKADKLKWIEYLVQELTTVRDTGDTLAERVPDQDAIALLLEKVKEMRKERREEAERLRVRELAQAKVDANFEATRNLLLQWQLQMNGMVGRGGSA